MSNIAQNTQLLIFLIVLAVLLIVAIVVAVVAIKGRPLSKSTYGNNIEEGRDIGPSRIPDRNSEEEPSSSGVSGNSGADGRGQPRF